MSQAAAHEARLMVNVYLNAVFVWSSDFHQCFTKSRCLIRSTFNVFHLQIKQNL